MEQGVVPIEKIMMHFGECREQILDEIYFNSKLKHAHKSA